MEIDMHNCSVTMDKNDIVIRIKADANAVKGSRPSATGKTRLLASTNGAVAVACGVAGLKVAVNATIPPT
jgi:hypothetical protein